MEYDKFDPLPDNSTGFERTGLLVSDSTAHQAEVPNWNERRLSICGIKCST